MNEKGTIVEYDICYPYKSKETQLFFCLDNEYEGRDLTKKSGQEFLLKTMKSIVEKSGNSIGRVTLQFGARNPLMPLSILEPFINSLK